MYLVLSAARGVSDADIADARSALATLGATPDAPRRLSDCAADIRFRGALHGAVPVASGLDVNLVPAANRRKKLLIADMDSTMINVECIDELADFAGVKPEVEAVTEAAMRGELGFEQSLTQRVALLKDLPVSALDACYTERIRLNPGAQTLVKTMNALGAHTALVSGGFTYFTERVAAVAGFAHHAANVLEIGNDALTGAVIAPILGREAKQTELNALCAARGITPAEVIAVGDGANDLAMVTAAGLGVAYHAKPALKAAANAVLDHSDLTALLALQGIGAGDYVS